MIWNFEQLLKTEIPSTLQVRSFNSFNGQNRGLAKDHPLCWSCRYVRSIFQLVGRGRGNTSCISYNKCFSQKFAVQKFRGKFDKFLRVQLKPGVYAATVILITSEHLDQLWTGSRMVLKPRNCLENASSQASYCRWFQI